MNQQHKRPFRAAGAFFASCTIVAALALLALFFAGSQPAVAAPAVAEPPAAPTSAGYPESVVNSEATYSVALPLIMRPPAWDPRGMIAFERRAGPNDYHDIFVMYNDGTRVENITNTPDDDDGAPTWSPDGNYIAFASFPDESSTSRILRIDLRDYTVAELTSGDHVDRWPTWSPDGSSIAFMREIMTAGHGISEIFVMDADGANPRNITNYDWGDDFPAWSRDGEWIAFTSERNWGGRDLWLTRPDGSEARIVRRTDWLDEIYPTWSPDGRLYYTFNIERDGDRNTDRLWSIRPDGTDAKPVFADDYPRYIASWAPDGDCFVFYCELDEPDKEIWKWCNGYGAAINLTNNDVGDEFPAWSPAP